MLFIALLLQTWGRPFVIGPINRLEFYSLCTTYLSLFTGFVFYAAQGDNTNVMAVKVLEIIVIVIIVGM